MIRSDILARIIGLCLVLTVFAAFGQLLFYDFITIDDGVYVTSNPYVRSGITAKNIGWAFSTFRAEFWHPLTWLSLMADTQIFGTKAAGYHFTNVLLHALNALLLFLFLKRATAKLWSSAFVAALFALHPLHVESVAWIAERKDVLSTFFWLLTLWCYVRYVEQPALSRYVWVLVFFTLGLMAKPMLITLPFTLLLLDYWPLCRFQHEGPLRSFLRTLWPFLYEKLPLFAMATAAAIVTCMAQKYGGGLDLPSPYPIADRIANALISYGSYIWKMIWPQKLAFFYPFPAKLPIWQFIAAIIILGVITAWALKSMKDRPYIIVGWLWYLGTLVPVIGLVKIGDFAMADRYTYVPLIGLFIILAWTLPAILAKWRHKTVALCTAAIAVMISCAAVTWIQTGYWFNSITLYRHALRATHNNFFAHYAIGDILAGRGKMDEAISHFAQAVEIRPDKASLQNALGRALASQGRFDEASPHLRQALQIGPALAETHYHNGLALVAQGQFEKSIDHFSKALQLHPALRQARFRHPPESTSPHFKRARRFEDQGDIDSAIREYRQAFTDPAMHAPALIKVAKLYAAKKDYARALALYQIDPTVDGIKRAFLAGYQNWVLIKNISIG